MHYKVNMRLGDLILSLSLHILQPCSVCLCLSWAYLIKRNFRFSKLARILRKVSSYFTEPLFSTPSTEHPFWFLCQISLWRVIFRHKICNHCHVIRLVSDSQECQLSKCSFQFQFWLLQVRLSMNEFSQERRKFVHRVGEIRSGTRPNNNPSWPAKEGANSFF